MSYPGLESHPQHALMQRLRNGDYGCGGILTLDLGSLQARHPASVVADCSPAPLLHSRNMSMAVVLQPLAAAQKPL